MRYLNPCSIVDQQKPEEADMLPKVYREVDQYLCIEDVGVAKITKLVDIIHANLSFFSAFNLKYPSISRPFWEILTVGIFKKV